MKILLISNMYPTSEMPGFGVFVKNVADGLMQYNIEIVYLALICGRGRTLKEKLRKYCWFYIRILNGFFRKYDVIYIHYPNMALPILLLLLKIKKKKIVVNLHGEDLFYSGKWGSKLGRLNEKFLTRYATRIVVPSLFFKSELLLRGICEEDRIFISPSGGISPELFHPFHREPKEKICLGYVGRIDEGKGWLEYIETLHLLDGRLDFRGIIIGYGAQEAQLFRLINAYGLKDKVEILRGVAQNKLCFYYNQFDLLLFTTQLSESLGLVGLEAMACGTPVIGTDIGGIPSYLIDGANGFLVPKYSVTAICDAVLRYVRLTLDEKNTMCRNCLVTSQRYHSDKVIGDLTKMFNHL